jgi:hypothetical protein
VALSPTRARGHVAERRAAAPRSPRRPKGAPMHIRAVMRSYAKGIPTNPMNSYFLKLMLDSMSEMTYIGIDGLL